MVGVVVFVAHELVVAAAIGHQVVAHILGAFAPAALGQKSFHLSDPPTRPLTVALTALSWPATPPLGPPLCLEKFRVCMLIKVITWRTPPKRKQKPKWRAAANCTQLKKKNKLSGRILSTLSIW